MTVKVEKIDFPYPQKLAGDYLQDFPRVSTLFEYNPWQPESFHQRLSYLQANYGETREVVAQTLLSYNQSLEAGQQTIDNIQLFSRGAEVVITGQQAGIFTGPIYTIYKAITTINLAKKLSQLLSRPVVPIFWIASEDHDFLEVNHTFFLNRSNQMEKITLNIEDTARKSVGTIWEQQAVADLVSQLQATLVETEFSATIIDFLLQEAEKSTNLADWFGRIMLWLFKEQGLIMADPADPAFRALEASLFENILVHNQALAGAFSKGVQAVCSLGYTPQVELDANHANLFIYLEGERTALYRMDGGGFGTKDGQQTWTMEEILELCKSSPASFSTNVVTRPLAQERLFPVLAYVAGPGEISYYGLYKKVYTTMGYQMPVIYPRLHATILEANVQRLMDKYQLDFLTVVGNLKDKLQTALAEADEVGIDEATAVARQEITEIYASLIPQLSKVDPSLEKLGQENLARVLGQLDFFTSKAQQKHRHNSESLIKHFQRIETSLWPNGGRQERVFNVITYLNKYGMELLAELVTLATNVEREHLLVYLG